jgi:hypothetical protein
MSVVIVKVVIVIVLRSIFVCVREGEGEVVVCAREREVVRVVGTVERNRDGAESGRGDGALESGSGGGVVVEILHLLVLLPLEHRLRRPHLLFERETWAVAVAGKNLRADFAGKDAATMASEV